MTQPSRTFFLLAQELLSLLNISLYGESMIGPSGRVWSTTFAHAVSFLAMGALQVSGAQEALEAVARVLVRLRSERMTALEAQQHQRRKQATAVAVRLGRFGWALVNREGAPFVQVTNSRPWRTPFPSIPSSRSTPFSAPAWVSVGYSVCIKPPNEAGGGAG